MQNSIFENNAINIVRIYYYKMTGETIGVGSKNIED